MRQSV